MSTESAQYPTVHCIFLRKEFILVSSIFTELLLRFEDSDLLFGSFNKVNEIDMLLQDSLYANANKGKFSQARTGWFEELQRTARHA
jgi:hypothetical protein